MAFRKFTLYILCLINLLPVISVCAVDQSTVGTCPQNAYFPSLYQPNTFQSFSPGTNFLSSIPSANASCQDGACRAHNYLTNWYAVIFGMSLVISNIGFLLHFIWLKSSKDDDYDGLIKQKGEPNSLSIASGVKIFTFADLEAATFGFLEETRFAEGSYSIVYRGCFSDGSEVAIKRAKKIDDGTESCFRIELSVLTEVHHDNLLSLTGYCTDNNERLLVFEYMKNGSLYEHLYETKYRHRPDSPFHTWKLRIKILLDCARGIECIHRHANRGIIHRDIKVANILLDENWNAYISDFGLALVGPEPGSERLYEVERAGTIGYMDPECNEATRSITLKSDVYSFGIVMIEMLTAKGVCSSDDDAIYADYIAPKIIAGELQMHLDRRPKSPVGVDAQVVQQIGRLAERCVRRSSVLRPTMSEVVQEMEYVLTLFD